MSCRLAIVATHPIQYFAPWYRQLATDADIAPHVLYLWDFGVEERRDPGFGKAFQWDVPLLAGYKYEFVPNRSPRPGTDRPWGLWNPSIIDRVEALRPDAILLSGYNFVTFLRLIFSGKTRAPMLFRGDSHRLVPRSGLREAVRRKLISTVFKRIAAFLYVGEANREYFRYHGVPEGKLYRAPHAVDNERFMSAAVAARTEAAAWKRSLGIPEEDLVVLFAGKLEAKKRPLDLLEAFLALDQREVSLLFVGSGHLEQPLREAARGHDRVFFAPFQNQSLMPRTYAAANLFVLPSFGPSETWGLAVNEAMCIGLPVIASDHVGCARDLVVPGTTGLVFRAGDVGALRAALAEAVGDRERLAAWGEAGRALVREFSYSRMTEGLRAALRSLGVLRSG